MKEILYKMLVDNWLPTVGGVLFLVAGAAYFCGKSEAAMAIAMLAGVLTGVTAASAIRK